MWKVGGGGKRGTQGVVRAGKNLQMPKRKPTNATLGYAGPSAAERTKGGGGEGKIQNR